MRDFYIRGNARGVHSSQMIHLLQRMDDSDPRHQTASAAVSSLPADLRSLTVLADAEETEQDALEDWSRGLDWVEWLFSGVRQRMTHLHFQPTPNMPLLKLQIGWENFTQTLVTETCGPHLLASWQQVQASDLRGLIEADLKFTDSLESGQKFSSLEAGRLLLKATRGARYQGLLQHLRTAIDANESPGHFLTVWAAVGHFFQLSLTNLVAEYLRLEWSTATRSLPASPDPVNLAALTARLMKGSEHTLKVVS